MENSSTDLHSYTSDIDYIDSDDIKNQQQMNNFRQNKKEMNVKVNLPAEEGQTTLHVAVKKGHLEMVSLLLEGGANVNKSDLRGCTPKTLA